MADGLNWIYIETDLCTKYNINNVKELLAVAQEAEKEGITVSALESQSRVS